MDTKNNRFREFLNIPVWHNAGYTGSRCVVGYGENFENTDDYASHARRGAFVFHEIAPDAELIFLPEQGVSNENYMSKQIETIIEKGICCWGTSLLTSVSGLDVNAAFAKAKDFCTFFTGIGNGEGYTHPYSRLSESEYVYGVGAIHLNLDGTIYPEPYSVSSENVDFVSPTDWYAIASAFDGTSGAQPVILGLTTLINDFFIDKTGCPLSSEMMYQFLKDNSQDIYTDGYDTKTGWGYVRLPNPEDIDITRYGGNTVAINASENAIGQGVDCMTPVTVLVAAEIAASGHKFVGRYLVPPGYSKRLTASEAQILTDAGLLILAVYETTAARPSGGAVNGAVDGAKALAAAQEIGMPTSGYIYFAVDYGTHDFDTIEAYLRAAKSQIGDYGIGVYGSYYVVEEMRRRGVCDGYWQCIAWSSGNLSEHANAYQYAWDQSLAGIGVDLNYLYSTDGLWNLNEEENMVRYERLSDIPNEYGFRDIVNTLMDAQIINGDGSDTTGNNDVIDLSHDQVRSLIFEYRGGAFDRKLIAMGMTPAVPT